LLVFPALEGTALAEESSSRETAPVTSNEVTSPVRKLDLPSRVGPILTISAGGATTLVAGTFLALAATSWSCPEDAGTNCSAPDLTGLALTSALGVMVLTVGIVWLVDVNSRRHALERHARTAMSRPLLLPVYEPTTRTAGLTFSQQF
jgi:hypothetical protein